MGRLSRVHKGWAVAGLVLVALLIAGTLQASLDGGTNEEASTAVSPDAVAPAAGIASSAVGSTANSGKAEIAPVPPDGGSTAAVPGSPRIVRTADVRIQLGKGGFGAAFDRVAALAGSNGGFVQSSSTASNKGARSGELTVRVPADRFDGVRQSLGDLGKVDSQSIRGEDVSGQLVDYGARLTSLQAQEDALRVLVGQAKAVNDVLQVQQSLFSVRQQIEQLTAQKANLEQSVNLATLQVSLYEPGALGEVRPVTDDRSLAHSVRQSVDGMIAVVGGMIVVVGYLVPLAVLGLLGWGASRVFRRRPAAPAVHSAS